MPAKPKDYPELIVRESLGILIVIAVIIFIMLGYFVEYNIGGSIIGYIILFAFVPIVFWILRKKAKRSIIIINKTGIYSYDRLLTDWEHFENAAIKQMPVKIGDISDNVMLVIQYFKPGFSSLVEQKLRLNNTINKSEEKILGAIEYFKTAHHQN